jgi:quercetin dioxygenase-like cupin family protein
MRVEHWNREQDGELSESAMRRKLQQLGYHVTRYTYSPGTFFPTHIHSIDKIDAVLSGSFRISMGRDSVLLKSGDFIFVPAGAEHSAEVVGEQAVVSLDAVKS